MKIILLVWKDGVVERFGMLGASLRLLGHEAVLGLHPRSRGPASYEGRRIGPEPLASLLDRQDPDCLVLWNGDLPFDEVVKAECARRAIPILYCEMGWFPQAETVYFDWEGVNGSSSIRRGPLAGLKPPQSRALDGFLARYHALMGVGPSRPPSDFLLVPLQVETDSNILKYSPIKTMAEFVRKVRAAFPTERLLVRPHPKSSAPRFGLPRGCSYAEPADALHGLLRRSKAVVALNSTVVLEALSHFKPVIAFGEGLFSGHGAALDGARTAPRAMRAFAGAPLDARRRDRIARLLYELVFRRTFYNRDLADPGKVSAAPFYSTMLRKARAGERLRRSEGPGTPTGPA